MPRKGSEWKDAASGLIAKAKSVEEIRKKLSIVQKYDKQKGLVAVSMREVYNLMPANVSLAMFTFDSIDGIILRGSANTMPDVVRLSEALNKSPNFRNTEIKYISERVTGSGKVIDFQIRSQIKR